MRAVSIGSGRPQFILPEDRFINATKPLEPRPKPIPVNDPEIDQLLKAAGF